MPGLKRLLQKGEGDLETLEKLLRDNKGAMPAAVFVGSFPNYGIKLEQKHASGLVTLTDEGSGAQVMVNAHNSHKEMSHAEMIAVVLRLKREIAKRA